MAVYFKLEVAERVLACDRWKDVGSNLRAIAKHIEALRGQERWGVGTLDQAFRGYAALPEEASEEAWWSVLGMSEPTKSREAIKLARKTAAQVAHPDRGGSHDAMSRVNAAYKAGLHYADA